MTCGEAVGLPEGQMGNSEVGHLNLGAGRVVYQELQRINVAIRQGTFVRNRILLGSIRRAKTMGKALHLLGLVSDGGVHSHIDHLKAIIDACGAEGLKEVYVHAFTDGRDTDPRKRVGLYPGAATTPGRQHWQDRHGERPVLCHGQRQTLGAGPDGL